MLGETTPAATHIQDAISRLQSAGLDGKIEFAVLGCFQRLVVALEYRLRIAAGGVHELEIELIAEVVVARNRLPVGFHPPDEQWRNPTPQRVQRMMVAQ